jgi:hypothetical protein
MGKLNKIVNHLISGFVGLLLGLLIWVAFTIAPPASADEVEPMTPETAYPLSPASQCLWFGRFCESQEDGGLCFDCKVI